MHSPMSQAAKDFYEATLGERVDGRVYAVMATFAQIQIERFVDEVQKQMRVVGERRDTEFFREREGVDK